MGTDNKAPKDLALKIMSRIQKEERRRTRARLLFFGTLFFVSLFALIPALNELYVEFSQTGFSQFVSLIFSDAGTLAMYWQDFIFSLAESFPVIGTSMVLGSLFALLLSLRFVVRDASLMWRGSNASRA